MNRFDVKLEKAIKNLVSFLKNTNEDDIPANGNVSIQIDISRDDKGVIWMKAWDGKDDDFEFFVVSSEHDN